MSASYNKAFILGTLTDLPHMRYSQHGDPHALLTLKCSTKDSPNDDTVHTDWVKAVCHHEAAEYAERHLNPGDLIWVEGPVELLEWTDGRSKVHKDTVVTAEKLIIVAAISPEQAPAVGISMAAGQSVGRQPARLKKEVAQGAKFPKKSQKENLKTTSKDELQNRQEKDSRAAALWPTKKKKNK